MSPLRLAATLPLVLTLLLGCTSTPSHPGASATGAMRLAVSTPAALPAEVSRVAVTVSGSDMPSIPTELVLTNGAWGGLLGDIPAGTHRTFLAQAFTSSNTLRYEGRAEDVTVTAGATGLVSLTLLDVSPPAPFSNEAPLIDSLVASATTVSPGASLSLTSSAHDPNPGDGLTYAWSAPTGSFSAPAQANTTWTSPTTQGAVTLTLTVSDSRGAALAQRLTVDVTAGSGADEVRVGFNTAPKVVALSSSQSVLEVGQQTALSVSATDADADALGYQWSATCAGSFTGATSPSATFTPSALPTAACNNCQLSVVLKDGRGGQNTGSLALCVAKDSRSAPPSLTRSYQSSLTARAHQQLTFEVGASDPAGSALTFGWTANVGSLGTPSTSATSSRVLWTAPGCVPAGSTLGPTATVTNASGLKTTRGFTVTGVPTCAVAWSTTGSMPTTLSGASATPLQDGDVLAVGGDSFGNTTAELYHPATGTWATTYTGTLAPEPYDHTATLLASGKVLFAGGSSKTDFSTAALLYNPATHIWTSAGSLASTRTYHTATLLADGRVMVTGGVNMSSSVLASTEMYSPSTGTWRLAYSSMDLVRYNHTATRLTSGKVLITGGLSNTTSYTSALLFDPASESWLSTGSMASARYFHTATLLTNGTVLVTGGLSGSYLSTAELYNPATGTWTAARPMASTRYLHTATLLDNGKVLVTGGYNGTTQGPLATAELYDPSTDSWSSAGSMNSRRQGHQATLLSNGKVLVSGGYDGTALSNTAELYDPASIP